MKVAEFTIHIHHCYPLSTRVHIHDGQCVTLNDGPCVAGCTGDQDTVLSGAGLAFCASSDQFNRAKGRKVALARAIRQFPKETRKRIWNGYFEQVRRP